MLGGQSTAKGVVLYETKKSGATGVFCYFENDRPQWKTGDYKQLIEEQRTLTAPLCKSGTGKFFLNVLCNLILCIVILILVIRNVGGFFPIFGTSVALLLAFPSLLIVVQATFNNYQNREDFLQFRRFHGTEHMALNHSHGKSFGWTLEDFRKLSHFHRECGTVSAGTRVLLAAAGAICFAIIPTIGFWKALLIFVAVLILLFINLLWNRFNPLLVFQTHVVSRPTDREMELVLTGLQWLIKDVPLPSDAAEDSE